MHKPYEVYEAEFAVSNFNMPSKLHYYSPFFIYRIQNSYHYTNSRYVEENQMVL